VSPVTVMAESNKTDISGIVPASISVIAPASILMGDLVPGTTVTSTVQSVEVRSNADSWSLKVAEYNGENDGKMAKTDFHPMTNPLQVKGGDTTYASLATPVTLKSAGKDTMTINDIYFLQVVAPDETTGAYFITVVFTATTGT